MNAVLLLICEGTLLSMLLSNNRFFEGTLGHNHDGDGRGMRARRSGSGTTCMGRTDPAVLEQGCFIRTKTLVRKES